LADPSPILQTFSSDRALGEEFHVEALIAVVDAAAGEDTLEWSTEARKQVILADRLIVTKTDLADATALSTKLLVLNPRAELVTARNGEVQPEHLTAPGTDTANAFIAEATHSDGIASFVMRPQQLGWLAFSKTMDTLTALRGPDLLRVKGFVDVEGCQGPVLVQFVQHLAHPPVELTQWPDAERQSRLVFITRNLPEEKVRALFAAVDALA
jgi:G3E family GTPase